MPHRPCVLQARIQVKAGKRQEVEQRINNVLYPPCAAGPVGTGERQQPPHAQMLEQEVAR